MNKGLDAMFMHFGVRKEDMTVIKGVCEKHEVDFDWFKDEILKKFHEAKIKNEELSNSNLQKIIEKALSNT